MQCCIPAKGHVDRPPVEHAHENGQPFLEVLGEQHLSQQEAAGDQSEASVGSRERQNVANHERGNLESHNDAYVSTPRSGSTRARLAETLPTHCPRPPRTISASGAARYHDLTRGAFGHIHHTLQLMASFDPVGPESESVSALTLGKDRRKS